MISVESKAVIDSAQRLYEEKLQGDLELRHRDRFVAIEPVSGDFFLGDTFDEAGKSAWDKHPGRLAHIIRVGHRAALHIGLIRL